MSCPLKIKIMAMIVTGLLLFSIFSTTNRITNVNASKLEENNGASIDSSTLSKSSVNYEEIRSLESNTVQDIELKDDAFHKTNDIYHLETWYFDAVFTNKYSMAVIVTIAQKDDTGSVLTGLYIYKDTELIYSTRTLHQLDQLSASEEKLDMKISDETIMKCDIDADTSRWNYYVSENFDDVSIDLNFINMTDGWKTDIIGGWWFVSPRLSVIGSITLESEKIAVTGEGYHDHNWFYTNTPLMQEGWHFGNIAGDSLGITWANIVKDNYNTDRIVVLNQKNSRPIMVDPKDVTLTVEEYMESNGKKVPKIFTLEIQTDRLHASFYIETLNFNCVNLPLLVNYWRFHIKIVGNITFDSVTEKINNVGIAELMKFFRIDIDSKTKNIKKIEIPTIVELIRAKLFTSFSRIYEQRTTLISKRAMLSFLK